MIERHSKVFVPVSVDERLPDKPDVYLTNRGHLSYELSGIWHDGDDNRNPNYWLEEKENVYALSEQEFDFMQSYLSRLQAMLESGETYSFDNEYDFKDSIEIKDFFQSKTNPQTENK